MPSLQRFPLPKILWFTYPLDSIFKMAVNVTSFRCAIERVCDVFKIPSLFPEQEKCFSASSTRRAAIGETGRTGKTTSCPFSLHGVEASSCGDCSTDILDTSSCLSKAWKSSNAKRFAACSWKSLDSKRVEQDVEKTLTGKGKELEFVIFRILAFTSWIFVRSALRFFNNDRQAQQMCAELITTAISNDKISSRTLKTVFFRTSTRFLSVFLTILFLQRTHELISQVRTSREGGDSHVARRSWNPAKMSTN